MRAVPAIRTVITLLALAASMAGCMPRNDAASAAPDMHNSRNALDWAGVYEGVLPCADCPGIQTRLSLQQDRRFELSVRYIDRQAAPSVSTGSFSWNAEGNTITLDGDGRGAMYRVGEGRLLQLDRDGSMPAPSSHNRTLTKEAAGVPAPSLAKALQDHRWTLRAASDAQGKPIAALAKTAPIVLDFDAQRVAIRGACNNMNGGFQLSSEGPQPVHFRPMFGSFGGAMARGSLTFMSHAAVAADLGDRLGLHKQVSAVKNCRGVRKRHMVHNGYTPKMQIDAQTYEVRADGELLTCEPVTVLPMAQRYFLF